jgi:hypothetical protein
MDICQLILDDHHEQRRLFAMIDEIDPNDTAALAAIWQRLGTFLEVHAAAEEAIFYPALLKAGKKAGDKEEAEEATLDAIKDHNEIRDAVRKGWDAKVGSKAWYAALAEANKANGDHMAEEEREGLTEFRKEASLDLRHRLAVQFASFDMKHITGVEAVDKDPEEYVKAEG